MTPELDDQRGSTFDHVDLSNSRFTRVRLRDVEWRNVNFSGSRFRGAAFNGARMDGIELCDVEITGEVVNLVINGVDVAPMIEAELNRRDPDRALMRPDDADGFRRAWPMIQRRWDETIAKARTLPAEALDERVDGEWSFTQTLRHLNFASAAWVGRMMLGNPAPWHRLDLPWEEAPEWADIPLDKDARPALDEVLAIRRERTAMVGRVIDVLTDEQLAGKVTRSEPGWPQEENFPVIECLRIVLNEEWEHRNFAERDLAVLLARATAGSGR
jgi:hypothetical protein